MSSLLSIKAKNEARLMEEQRTERRRMALLVLIHHQLLNSGYIESAERLQAESGIAVTKNEVADNIDLMSILQDYEDYFQMRFNKQPKFYRKRGGGDDHSSSSPKPKKTTSITSSPAKSTKEKFDHPPPPPSYSSSFVSNSPSPSSHSHSPSVSSSPSPSSHSVSSHSPSVSSSSSPSSSRSNSNSNLNNFLPRLTPPSTSHSHTTVTTNTSGQTTLTLNGMAAPSYNSSGSTSSGRRKIEREDGEPRVKIKDDDLGLSGKPLSARKHSSTPKPPSPPPILSHDEQPVEDFYDYKILKPLPPHLTGNSEFRELSEIITRDIFFENPNVKWSDIAGLENAKRLLNEAVAMPLKYPQLFTGLLTPWKGVLLFGPPGTGKTMLAKAVASMSRTTFFNISAASIVSKWRGDSEKLVRVLFELARHHAPSTIFLDEIDALMSQRGAGDAGGGEHEASRRMKTELLIQVDGLAKSTEQVFLLAVSNLPWTLDSALLRRLEKRIYVPLPSVDAREDMFRHYLSPEMAKSELPYKELATKTEGYSGSDIRLVCKESAMFPLRRLVEQLERGELQYNEELQTDPVTVNDVEEALKSTKSSAHRDLDKYTRWQEEFGSV